MGPHPNVGLDHVTCNSQLLITPLKSNITMAHNHGNWKYGKYKKILHCVLLSAEGLVQRLE